jgi:hypothetical protein
MKTMTTRQEGTMGTRSTRIAALSGVVFVVLLAVGFVLGSGSPSTSSSATKVQSYFVTHKGRIGGAGLLTMLAVLFGMFFFGYLRAYFRSQHGAEWLATVFFGGAIIFAVSGTLGAGFDLAAADHPAALSASSLQLLNILQSNVGYTAICAGLAVMYFAAGFVIYKTKLLPGWLAWVSWLLGLLSATFFLGFIAFIGTALWSLYVSLTLAARNPALEAVGGAGHSID